MPIGQVMYDPGYVMLCSSPPLPQATFIPFLNEFISSERNALDQRALKYAGAERVKSQMSDAIDAT